MKIKLRRDRTVPDYEISLNILVEQLLTCMKFKKEQCEKIRVEKVKKQNMFSSTLRGASQPSLASSSVEIFYVASAIEHYSLHYPLN